MTLLVHWSKLANQSKKWEEPIVFVLVFILRLTQRSAFVLKVFYTNRVALFETHIFKPPIRPLKPKNGGVIEFTKKRKKFCPINQSIVCTHTKVGEFRAIESTCILRHSAALLRVPLLRVSLLRVSLLWVSLLRVFLLLIRTIRNQKHQKLVSRTKNC